MRSGKKRRDSIRQRQEWDSTASITKLPLDVTEGTRGEIVELLKKVEQSGKWPQKACTRMFFQIPKNITSERPIALMPTWHQKRRHGSRGIVLVGTLLTAKWRSPANSVGNSAGDGKI